MTGRVEIKCPHCYVLNIITQYDYDIRDWTICMECYNLFYFQ
jgi:phage FluMu protein Com